MLAFKLSILLCILALSTSTTLAQGTKSDTDYILQGMAAMDAANVRARTIEGHFKNKNYDAAILELNKMLQTCPADRQALLFRGLAYFHKKQYDLALADLNKIKPNPLDRSTGRMHALKAKIYQEKGTRDAAVTEAILGINADPWVDESYAVLESLLTKEQYIAELSKVIASKERNISSHYPLYARRGGYYADAKMYDLAVPDIVNALKRKDDGDFAQKAWSFLDFYFNGKPDAYIVQLSTIIKDSTGIPADALARRAVFYFDQKKFDLAVADMNRAINARTQVDGVEVARLFRLRGYSYASWLKYDLALIDLNRIIASKFYQSSDLDLRSQIYCLTGKKAEAKEDEKKVLALGGKVSKPCQ